MTTRFEVPGLAEPVEILVDRWGVPHLYAGSGTTCSSRRASTPPVTGSSSSTCGAGAGWGCSSEVFGEAYVEHDRAARLFLYRGDMAEEWLAYGSDTERVTTRVRRGVNAFVDPVPRATGAGAGLPPEFAALGYVPALLGAVGRRPDPQPRALLQPGRGGRAGADAPRPRARGGGPAQGPRAARTSCASPRGSTWTSSRTTCCGCTELATAAALVAATRPGRACDGSNNWVHRAPPVPPPAARCSPTTRTAPSPCPSLRYLAHLSAPGLDVIGAGEPALPGVSIGHNGQIAFGLTIFPDRPGGPVRLPDQPRRTAAVRVPGALGANGAGRPRRSRYAAGEPVDGRAVVHPARPGDPRTPRARQPRSPCGPPGWSRAWRPTWAAWTTWTRRTPDAFVAAMSRWGAPGENQVYAAPDGTIGWRPAGRVPSPPELGRHAARARRRPVRVGRLPRRRRSCRRYGTRSRAGSPPPTR